MTQVYLLAWCFQTVWEHSRVFSLCPYLVRESLRSLRVGIFVIDFSTEQKTQLTSPQTRFPMSLMSLILTLLYKVMVEWIFKDRYFLDGLSSFTRFYLLHSERLILIDSVIGLVFSWWITCPYCVRGHASGKKVLASDESIPSTIVAFVLTNQFSALTRTKSAAAPAMIYLNSPYPTGNLESKILTN